ncbi:AlbA family DNA-binding domain-containing protein [Anditalea andensis]|uniref:2OG-Fe(II) oxygenase n=1 Tax=Anditalea andensis TaxID=1048983 RepID=A0A074LE77_9BACT|nr:ATP-binding protein [Anditalea andensis]KEO72087.1 2OG-Fe(II) oxygenase [Anditalea andensis]
MTLQEVTRLAKMGEGLHVEFKKKVAHPEKIVREIIAMANTEGGYLLIGIDDDGTVSGQKYIEEDIFILDKAIKSLIKPNLQPEKAILPITAKKGVAIYQIEKSNLRPHFILEDNKKKSYVRVEDRSIQASKEVWEIIKRQKHEQDVFFNYGEKETLLMKALTDQPNITLNQFAQIANLSRYMASRTLIKLVLANVLKIVPREMEDLYALK